MRLVLVRVMFMFALQIAPALLCTFWEYPWTTNTNLKRPSAKFSATSLQACLKRCFKEKGCAITYFIEYKCYLVIDGDKSQAISDNELKEVETKGFKYYELTRITNATKCPKIGQSLGMV